MTLPTIICTVTLLATGVADAQKPRLTPSSPASEQPPVWSRTIDMPDGRTFVTDGGLAIDTAVAKPSTLPQSRQPGAVFARLFDTKHVEDVGLGELGAGPFENTYATPKGVVLNGNYVKYLRGVLPRKARLRVGGGMDPIVVVLDATPIAVLMPVRR